MLKNYVLRSRRARAGARAGAGFKKKIPGTGVASKQDGSDTLPLGIYLGGGGLMLACLLALIKVIQSFHVSKTQKMMDIVAVLAYSAVAAAMFGLSLPAFTGQLDRPTYDRVPQIFKAWDQSLDKFQLTSSYGLFRRMTGVGGRPEIIIGRNLVCGLFFFQIRIRP